LAGVCDGTDAFGAEQVREFFVKNEKTLKAAGATGPGAVVQGGDRELQTLKHASQLCEEYALSCGQRFYFFSFRLPLLPAQPSQFALTNYPRGWLEHYRDRSYIKIDPVVQRIMSSLQPFTWSAVAAENSHPAVIELFQEATAHGLDGGFCVPLYAPHGAHAALTLSGGAVPADSQALRSLFGNTWMFGVSVLDSVLKLAASSGSPRRSSELTERQEQALTGIAQGQTLDEIAQDLGVSLPRVKDLVSTCCTKLGVTTREQAIVRALTSGQIHPVTYSSGFKIPMDPSRPDSLFIRSDRS